MTTTPAAVPPMTTTTTGAKSARWLAEIEGETMDVDAIAPNFPASGFSVETVDGKRYLVSPELDACGTPQEARAAALELLEQVNLSLSVVLSKHKRVSLGTIREWRDAKLLTHYTLVAETGVYRTRFFNATVIASGSPARRALGDRAALLARTNPHVRDALKALATDPPDWRELYRAFETAKKLTSSVANPDHKPLIAMGWAALAEAERFRDSVGPHRHGVPDARPASANPMTITEAREMVRRVITRLVEHLTP